MSPRWEFSCDRCGRIAEIQYESRDLADQFPPVCPNPECPADPPMRRLPAKILAFSVKGFNASNGYSGGDDD